MPKPRNRTIKQTSESTEVSNEVTTEVTDAPKVAKRVRERDVRVRIRSGPGVNFDHVNGEYLGKGSFEIDEIAKGVGSMSGWGHLANGKGWVALDFLEIIE